MNERIIYATNDGLAIIIPTSELAVEEVARKDVPAGADYWIVDATDIPTDRTFRDAWEADVSALGTPDGQGIGADAWFAEQKEKEVVNDNS